MTSNNILLLEYKPYYVYALMDPRTNLPFYIGKGKNDRCWQHLKEAKNKSSKESPKVAKIRKLLKLGLMYEVKIIKKNLSNNEANNYEIYYINRIGIVNLTNIASGGDGGNTRLNMSKEEIEQYNKKLKDKIRFRDKHIIEKIQTTLKNRSEKEKLESLEKARKTIENRSEERKEEVSKNMSNALKKVLNTPEARMKKSNLQKGSNNSRWKGFLLMIDLINNKFVDIYESSKEILKKYNFSVRMTKLNKDGDFVIYSNKNTKKKYIEGDRLYKIIIFKQFNTAVEYSEQLIMK